MRKYFVHDGQTEVGPLQFEELSFQKLTKETPIWYEGLEKWTTAAEVEELKYLFTPKLIPPPLRVCFGI